MYGVIKLNIPDRGRDKAGNKKVRKSSSAKKASPPAKGNTTPESSTSSAASSVSPDFVPGSTSGSLAVRSPPPNATNTSPTSPPVAAKRAITFIDYSATISNPQPAGHIVEQRRKDVRVHAAMASAEKRKATIAKKDAYGWQRRARLLNAIQLYGTTAARDTQSQLGKRRISLTDDTDGSLDSKDFGNGQDRSLAACDLLSEVVSHMPSNRAWYVKSIIERSSLPGKAIRTTLWDAVTHSPTLFQAAIFMAGTHSNTCGLPPNAIHDLGSGLILLRGASLAAIQSAVVSREVDSVTPIAIAMLAGWERRFGDRQSYEVHMKAWKSLSLPSKALDEDNVANLADLTLETFREGLDERSTAASDYKSINPPKRIKLEVTPVQSPSSFFTVCPLPVGFHVFSPTRAETRSLLRIISAMHTQKPSAPSSIPVLRRLGLENIAWNPCHSVSVAALPHLEESWKPPTELSALYHARAAAIPSGALLLHRAHEIHGSPWLALDLDAALAVHTMSCQHLRTEELLGTEYAEVAVWARFLLCAVSRDPDRDEELKRFMRSVGWRSWEGVREVLKKYLWMDGLIEDKLKGLWVILMGGELEDGVAG